MADSVLATGLQGVQGGLYRTQEAARDIAAASTVDSAEQGAEGRDVTGNLTRSLVDLKIGEQQVEASAAVVKTADEIMGTLIDIKA